MEEKGLPKLADSWPEAFSVQQHDVHLLECWTTDYSLIYPNLMKMDILYQIRHEKSHYKVGGMGTEQKNSTASEKMAQDHYGHWRIRQRPGRSIPFWMVGFLKNFAESTKQLEHIAIWHSNLVILNTVCQVLFIWVYFGLEQANSSVN